MITAMDEAFPCKQCNQWHPHLYWHDNYDKVYSLAEHIEGYKRAAQRFKFAYSREQSIKYYNEKLEHAGIKAAKQEGECVICSRKTSFIEEITNSYICSHECKYKLANK